MPTTYGPSRTIDRPANHWTRIPASRIATSAQNAKWSPRVFQYTGYVWNSAGAPMSDNLGFSCGLHPNGRTGDFSDPIWHAADMDPTKVHTYPSALHVMGHYFPPGTMSTLNTDMLPSGGTDGQMCVMEADGTETDYWILSTPWESTTQRAMPPHFPSIEWAALGSDNNPIFAWENCQSYQCQNFRAGYNDTTYPYWIGAGTIDRNVDPSGNRIQVSTYLGNCREGICAPLAQGVVTAAEVVRANAGGEIGHVLRCSMTNWLNHTEAPDSIDDPDDPRIGVPTAGVTVAGNGYAKDYVALGYGTQGGYGLSGMPCGGLEVAGAGPIERCVPRGIRVQVIPDPGQTVDQYLTAWADSRGFPAGSTVRKTAISIARAAMDYGIVHVETGGSQSIYADGHNPADWTALGLTADYHPVTGATFILKGLVKTAANLRTLEWPKGVKTVSGVSTVTQRVAHVPYIYYETDPWWKTKCSNIPVDSNPAHADWADRIVAHHSKLGGEWKVFVGDQGMPFIPWSERTIDSLAVRQRAGTTGPVSAIPWNPTWQTRLATGAGRSAQVYDHATGRQWGVEVVSRPGVDTDVEYTQTGLNTNPLVYFGTNTLLAGKSYLVTSPTGTPADMRTYAGNDFRPLGGFIPQPVLQQELDAQTIEHVLYAIAWNNQHGGVSGSTGTAISPAGRFKNFNTVPDLTGISGVTVNTVNDTWCVPMGVRFGLDPAVATDAWIEAWAAARWTAGSVQKRNSITLAKAIRDYGIIYADQGDEAGIIASTEITGLASDSIKGLLTNPDNLIVYGPPKSTLVNGTTTFEHGYAHTIQYGEVAPRAPIASLVYTKDTGNPLRVSFDASASIDTDGTIVQYRWDFGDGVTAISTSPIAARPYSAYGTYTAKVTVVDNAGLTDTAQQTLTLSPVTVTGDVAGAGFTGDKVTVGSQWTFQFTISSSVASSGLKIVPTWESAALGTSATLTIAGANNTSFNGTITSGTSVPLSAVQLPVTATLRGTAVDDDDSATASISLETV